ncbi:MAG: hypothetical protein O9264_06685 [Leptospira sp.]|nr:hypothetical protein [Leptospira sp.]
MRASDKLFNFVCNFYTQNYDEIFHFNITQENLSNRKPIYIQTGREYSCRFCGRDKKSASFSKAAHAIPEFLGNKLLLSKNECDECNTFFGNTYEDSVSKYFHLNSSITGIKGKNGIPKYKTNRIPFQIKRDPLGNTVIGLEENNPSISVWPLRQLISIRWLRQPYIPLHLHKLFAKIALSLLPDTELENFLETRYWIRKPIIDLSHTTCFNSFALKSDALENFQSSFVSIFKRKNENGIYPYLLFLIQHAGTVFLTYIPSRKKDSMSKNLIFYPFPIERNFVLPVILDLNKKTRERFDAGISTIQYSDFLLAQELDKKKFLQVQY